MIFKGTATALITPFTDDGIDFDALLKLINNQVENNIDAVVVLGTTGEPSTMTLEEKKAVISFAVQHLKGRMPVIVGVGSNSTSQTVDMCRTAHDLGADALLVVTPYYNKCTQEGLIAHYTQVAQSTPLPIICYNVPSRTGVNLLPETMQKIAKLPTVAAIKEASGNMEQIQQCIRCCEGECDVYCGDDALTVATLAMGGMGVISVLSNVCPQLVVQMTHAFFDGDLSLARQLQLSSLPLIKALFCEVNPIPIKRACQLKGLCGGAIRLPLTPLSEAATQRLRTLLEEV